VLHDRYRQRLFAYVRQMLSGASRQDAEDVLQDVFVRAYGALRNDSREMNVRAWLYRVAHNRCIDHLRRPSRRPPRSSRSRASRCTTRSRRRSAATTCAAWSRTSAGCPSSSAPRC
jgi:RNA polymerase sigma factor (sigma-70 family)